jgi:sodium transport system permease protein
MSLFVIMFKEILDNLRDRQTVFYALLFGPVLLPLLLGTVTRRGI